MKRKILTGIMTAFAAALTFGGPYAILAGASANDIAGEDEEIIVQNDDTDQVLDIEYIWEADYDALSGEINAAVQGTGSRNIVAGTGRNIHVPSDVLRELAGKDVTLAMQTGYSLTFSLTGTDIGNFGEDLWIKLLSYDAIPASAKEAVLRRSDAGFEFGMEEKESYPFRVNVHMNFGPENAGKTAILYYYDESAGTLKYAGAFRATEAGDVMFGLNRGDEYLAVIADRNACMVVSGDTLSGIAARNGISLSFLMSANPQIKDADVIYPGQSIVIP